MHDIISSSDLAAHLAVDRERTVVAQELHDTICQSLVGIRLMINVLNSRVGRGEPLEVDDLEILGGMVDHVIDEANSLQCKMTAKMDQIPCCNKI